MNHKKANPDNNFSNVCLKADSKKFYLDKEMCVSANEFKHRVLARDSS